MAFNTFHHIGVAVSDLRREAERYAALGYELEGLEFEDPIQGVRGCFLVGGGPRLELLVELPGRDVLSPWKRRGIRLYHLAYETDDLDATLAAQFARRAKPVLAPVPAVAFDGRRIAFVMLPNLQLVEFIEAERTS
jgi:methylmalonyl-CoA/ethylmalonyl-CoA epimerase